MSYYTDYCWMPCRQQLPPQKVKVMTKIDDSRGRRNEQSLVFYKNLWWHPDMSMYVYYSPTHWAYLD